MPTTPKFSYGATRRRGAPRRTESRYGRAIWTAIEEAMERDPGATQVQLARRLNIARRTLQRYVYDFSPAPSMRQEINPVSTSRDDAMTITA